MEIVKAEPKAEPAGCANAEQKTAGPTGSADAEQKSAGPAGSADGEQNSIEPAISGDAEQKPATPSTSTEAGKSTVTSSKTPKATSAEVRVGGNQPATESLGDQPVSSTDPPKPAVSETTLEDRIKATIDSVANEATRLEQSPSDQSKSETGRLTQYINIYL